SIVRDGDSVFRNSERDESIAHEPRGRDEVRDVRANVAHVRRTARRMRIGVRACKRSGERDAAPTKQRGLRRRASRDRAQEAPGITGRSRNHRIQTSAAHLYRATLGVLANRIVHVEELAAVADEPVVVERQVPWNATRRELVDDTRREAREVVDVRDIGPELLEETVRQGVDRLIAIRLFEPPGVSKCVVDPYDPQSLEL